MLALDDNDVMNVLDPNFDNKYFATRLICFIMIFIRSGTKVQNKPFIGFH